MLQAAENHQRVAEGLREQIEKGEHVVVLVELVAGGVAANDLGEDVLRIVGRGQGHREFSDKWKRQTLALSRRGETLNVVPTARL